MSDRSLPHAVTATDMRLDAILAELRGLRVDLDQAPVAWRQRLDQLADDVAAVRAALPHPTEEPADGEAIELRGAEERERKVDVLLARVAAGEHPIQKRKRG